MPRRNTFIRKEDIEAWDTMPKRPEWLHRCLMDYKNAHMGLDLTDEKPEKSLGDIISESDNPLPLIIKGIEDAET